MKKSLMLLFVMLCALPMPLYAKSNFSATNIIAYVNKDRTQSGMSTLREDLLLTQAAQQKADDMARRGYFSHLEPGGTTPWHWLSSAGYYYRSAGENLAINFDDPKKLEKAWMNSSTHRANITKSTYSATGVGISYGMYRGKPATFIVQFFASPYYTSIAKS